MAEEQVSNNLITLVSASSMSSLKSGNVIVDLVLSMVLVLMIPILMKRVKAFRFFPWWTSTREKEYSIRLTGQTTHSKDGGYMRHAYSETFCALSKYMEEECNVKALSEFFVENFENANTQYIPDNATDLQLTEDISCNVVTTETDEGQGRKIVLTVTSETSLKNLQSFLHERVREYKDRMSEELQKSQKYFCPEWDEKHIRWKMYPFHSNKTMATVYFPEKKDILQKIEQFTTGQERYQRYGIPWTLGILLHGKHGTGKTSLIKALANYTERHIIEIPLNRVKTYGALRKIVLGEKIDGYKIPFEKRLYLMEDIDCLDDIVLSRETDGKAKKGKDKADKWKSVDFSDWKSGGFSNSDPLTLSHILNIIDGPLETPGRILIVTSNHPEKLDKALIRDGRMDIKLEMKPLSDQSLSEMIQTFFSEEDIPPLSNPSNLTPAEIQNLCFTKPFEEVCRALE